MYPLAQILHAKGYYLTGSDNNETDTLQAVRDMGIPVMPLGQRAENIQGADLIVHTAAIMDDNPELVAARASGVPVMERSELLGLVSSWFDNAICVCGTHGKTTTTSMLTQILLETDLDPTAVIGGKLEALHGSARVGHSQTMVCEACEFVDTFLKLSPDVAVVLNIDADHLDYFKTLDNIIHSFHRFCEMTSRTLIVNGDDTNTLQAIDGINGKEIIRFGYGEENDYYPKNIVRHNGLLTTFDLYFHNAKLTSIELHVPGAHNILNAVAACAAAIHAGASPEEARRGLSKFFGAHRRFEKLGCARGVTVADDYAHHPAELTVTLQAAMEMDFRHVWAVFQPFTYSRTAMLLDDFAKALSIPDHAVLTEIMGSREKNTYNIYSKDLSEKVNGCIWFPTFEEVADYIAANVEEGDLVITLGCGDVYKVARMILQRLEK